MKFRLLRGRHIAEDGKAYAGKLRGRNVPGMTDIVESDSDLVAKFGPNKFQRLDDAPSSSSGRDGAGAGDDEDEEETEDEDTGDSEEELSQLTVAELRDVAETEEVDLAGLTRKDEIVQAILSTRASK